MLDVELFGVEPGAHHLVSLALHVAATLILFAALTRMTAAAGASAFAAAVFALHPLHVESVAWIAERKDVLSGLLFTATLWAYAIYVRKPGWRRYSLVLALFAPGLMAKPMLVTLPFVLLLLDAWPLGRWRGWPTVREKLPLLALAAASSIVTFVVQEQAGAVRSFEALSMPARAANAVVAYVTYVGQTFWPAALAPIYPYPLSRPAAVVAGAMAFVAAVTALAIWRRRDRPYLAVGWFWYIGMLVPVIGLVQVGSQPTADRYTYLPMIGLALAVAWLARDAALRWQRGRVVAAALAVLVVAACAVTTRAQVTHWRSSIDLWRHAVRAVPGNYRAHTNLGHALEEAGRLDEAIAEYREATRIRPGYGEALNYLGSALLDSGRPDEALQVLEEAVRAWPRYVPALNNLGLALAAQSRPNEAVGRFREAIGLGPGFAPAHGNLGVVLAGQGRLDEAVAAFREARRLQPDAAQARANLARALTDRGRRHVAERRLEAALRDFDAALEAQYSFPDAHHERGKALAAMGRPDDALGALVEAARLAPTVADFHYDVAVVLIQLKRYGEAAERLQAALTIDPVHAEATAAVHALAKIVRASSGSKFEVRR
jgi:tetratricopeptide (TPR) repeat protein